MDVESEVRHNPQRGGQSIGFVLLSSFLGKEFSRHRCGHCTNNLFSLQRCVLKRMGFVCGRFLPEKVYIWM